MLTELPRGFTLPRCLHAQESKDECILWLKFLHDELEIWPMDRYGIAARHLGIFNGLSQIRQMTSDHPWLLVDIAQQRERRNRDLFARFNQLRQHPIVHRGWPDDVKVAEAMQQRFGQSVEEWADRLVLIRRFVIQRADQARQLMEDTL